MNLLIKWKYLTQSLFLFTNFISIFTLFSRLSHSLCSIDIYWGVFVEFRVEMFLWYIWYRIFKNKFDEFQLKLLLFWVCEIHFHISCVHLDFGIYCSCIPHLIQFLANWIIIYIRTFAEHIYDHEILSDGAFNTVFL